MYGYDFNLKLYMYFLTQIFVTMTILTDIRIFPPTPVATLI